MNFRLLHYLFCATAIALLPPSSAHATWVFKSVRSYGATGNGTTNDTAAINAAIAGETQVYFPPGAYKYIGPMTLPANTSYHLYGDGPGVSTIRFTGPNAGINGSNIGPNTLNVDGLTLAASSANTGTAIYAAFSESSGSTKFHTATIHNVQIIGYPQDGGGYWNAGITLYKAQNAVIDKLDMTGSFFAPPSTDGTQTGIIWSSSDTYATTGLQMTSVEIKFVNTALKTSGWVEGLYLSGFEFVDCAKNGLPTVDLRALAPPLPAKPGFYLANGNVDSCENGLQATNLDGVKISKILFNHNNGAETDGTMITFTKCFDVRVSNCSFVGGTANTHASPTPIPLKSETGIRLSDTHSAQITGNYFTHMLTNDGSAIAVEATSNVVRIINNIFETTGGLGGVTTPYDDQASGTYYRDNNQ